MKQPQDIPCSCCAEPAGMERVDQVLSIPVVRCLNCQDAGCDVQDGICQRNDIRPPMPADCLWDEVGL